ncbi:zinc-dependent peptidase, M16 family [Campylobacter blaseri]|uniref:Peptidase M16 n=1 Tax=Campylobacter blaseri TaxID=2042961 RepID=A0A2P8R0A8_9BACT|nr:M16 family metallopeptidase [Campylobacter blaseri]PSM51928.1 peptidase M16 [Campylobacter blaseri]PSM53712.1 peptidase M16 [Campylobacter blaseri]QKF85734.1 zinc-dependent peptidase, M16 family [Campylobacter blaseri]
MRKVLVLILLFAVALFGFENDKELIKKELENGFTYYLYKNETPKDSISLRLLIKAGSTDEKDSEQGLAHFVEHMAFNGTKDYNKNELIKVLESLGVKFGADLNAATGFVSTTYKLDIKNSDENIQKALNIFANMGFKVLFNEDDLEDEKGVIIAEEKNRRNAGTRIFEQSIPYYFKDSIFQKRLPIGDMDIIKNSTPDLLKGFYNKYYHPNNAVLVVAGDFDIDKMDSKIQKVFGDIAYKKIEHMEKNIGYFNELVVYNSHDKDIMDNSLNIMFEDNVSLINSYDGLKHDIKNEFISKLFSAINQRERSMGNTTLSSAFYPINLYNKKVLNAFNSSVLENDFENSIRNLLYTIKSIKEFGFNKNDFEDVKKDLKAANLSIFKKSKKRENSALVSQILDYVESNTTFLNIEDRYNFTEKILDELSLEEINAHFKKIVSANGVLIGLISKESVSFNKDDFLAIYEDIVVTENIEKELSGPILKERLKRQNPYKSSFDNVNLVHMYKFENGVNVYFKQIDTRKDNIFFKAFKKKGYSNFDDLKLANFSVNLSNGSGIGDFNDYEVQKITAGQVFKYSKYINRTSLGYQGNFMIYDIKNFFDAFYVDFHNPKIDENYFKNYKIVALDKLKKNEENPDYKFAKEFNDFYYDNNPKMEFTTKQDIINLDLNRSREFIRSAFENAGEYDFVFVGDMDPDNFIKIAKNYIGNLKGEKTSIDIVDDGVRPILGNHKFVKNYLSENVSKNTIFIENNELQNTPKNRLALEFATDILNILMREDIREKQGKVYGINAYSILKDIPYQYSNVKIYFTSNVKDSDKIVSDVKRIIHKLKTTFNDENELKNIKTIKKVALEKAYQQPQYWVDSLFETLVFDEYFFSYDEIVSLIDQITLDDIKRVAAYAFDTRNFIISSNRYIKSDKR